MLSRFPALVSTNGPRRGAARERPKTGDDGPLRYDAHQHSERRPLPMRLTTVLLAALLLLAVAL